MAAACEGLQLLMSLPIVPTGDIREVVMLYLKLAGFFDMQVLPSLSLPPPTFSPRCLLLKTKPSLLPLSLCLVFMSLCLEVAMGAFVCSTC